MQEHKSQCFIMKLSEMIEQSAYRMLVCGTRWKQGIYNSMRRAKILVTKPTVPIWKMWDPNRADESEKIIDKKESQN